MSAGVKSSNSNPHGLVVGQKLWYVPHRGRGEMPQEITVKTLGRRWFTVDGQGYWERERFHLEGLWHDGGVFASPGTAYMSREKWEERQAVIAAWANLQSQMDHAHTAPREMTLERIATAHEALGTNPNLPIEVEIP